MSGPTSPPPIVQFTIPGRPAGKKTSPNVIFPALMGMKLKKFPQTIAEEKAAGRRGHPIVSTPRDFVRYLAIVAQRSPERVPMLCLKVGGALNPSVVPPKTHATWNRAAKKVLKEVDCPRPCVPDGHLVGVSCVVYLEKSQTGDLINFEEAVWDALEEAGILKNDYWINDHADSRRAWTDPTNPRVEVAIYDRGPREVWKPPKVRVLGLDRDGIGPVRFDIVAPSGESVKSCSVPRETSRARLVVTADRIWQSTHGDRLPDGSTIACEGEDSSTQGALFG